MIALGDAIFAVSFAALLVGAGVAVGELLSWDTNRKSRRGKR